MRKEDLSNEYLARIATDWIAYFSAPEESRDSDLSLTNPFGIVCELVRYSSVYAWDLILFILEEDRNDRTLDLLSAGPLEDFIGEHGRNYIELIEEAAQDSARFRSLLAGVWQLRTADDIWTRVVAARGDATPFVCD